MISCIAVLSMHTSPRLQPGVGNAGGMNVYIDELAVEMASRGIRVVVFTRRFEKGTDQVVIVSPRYTVVRIDAGPPSEIPMSDMANYADQFADGVLRWITESGLAFDIIHSHYWLSGRAGVKLKHALKIPLANSFHTLGRVKDINRRADEPASPSIRTEIELDTIAQSNCVIAATPYEFDDLLDHYRADPGRLCISPPGIDHSLFQPGDRGSARNQLEWGAEHVLLCVGRIQSLKGFDIAINATADLLGRALGAFRLVIVGGPSGPMGTEELIMLRRLASDLGIRDNVDFVDAKPHRSLPMFYQGADLLLMPSRSESFGLVAAEAQACALPVIAAGVGGLAYVVEDGESGVLVDGHDPSAYAAAIDKLLSSPKHHAAMRDGAVAHAEQFSWDRTVERLLELYDGISAS